MKFQFLGTAAAEGVPGIFCTCENCVKSRQIGGRALRTRSQAIIDDQLLVDFPADTFLHVLMNQLQLEKVSHCLITHTHQDHLYAKDIGMMRAGFGYMPENYHLTFYGTEEVGQAISDEISCVNSGVKRCSFQKITPFETFGVDRYRVTPLPAIHDATSGPVFYQITDGVKKVLYAHDTHYFQESVWEYWEKEKPYFHMVSLDCTNALLPLTYIGHMGLSENVQVKNRMLEAGYADERTRFICNHFSHNGTHVVYDEFVPLAAKEGFEVSYDGMIVNL